MRIPRIYTPQALSKGATITLEEQASLHLSRVLRMDCGSLVELFDGSGDAFIAELTATTKKSVTVQIQHPLPYQPPSPLNSEIAIAVSKGDKMDLIVQKATELGVNCITPVISTRTDVRLDAARWQKKQEHWQQVMISACEQSGRNHLAVINTVQPLHQWLTQCSADTRLICHPQQASTFAALPATRQVALCFGSEGGFTDEEITQAQTAGFTAISLGPRILRAETAPLAALAIAQLQWGDYQ